MNTRLLPVLLSIAVFAGCTASRLPVKKKTATPVPRYELVSDWWKVPPDSAAGQISAVAVDNNQDVFVFRRTGRKWTNPLPDSLISLNTVTVFNGATGEETEAWGANHFILPHGITVDAENNVWITDVGLHQVFKFTHDGKLLKTYGTAKVAGNDSSHFYLPTDVAVAKDGSFYVSDGYGNSRVIKFSASGKYLLQWGIKGTAAGAFQIPHTVALDADGNVYVADRENNRIQKFDPAGKFIREWINNSGNKLYALAFDKKDNNVIAVDLLVENKESKGADLVVLDTSLNVITRFGRSGSYNGPVSVYHDVAVDKDGNFYTADILGNTVQKFRRLPR